MTKRKHRYGSSLAGVTALVFLFSAVLLNGCSSDQVAEEGPLEHERIVDDTNRLKAGQFIRIDDDVMIGAHPHVFDEIRATGGMELNDGNIFAEDPHLRIDAIDPTLVEDGLRIEVETIDPESITEFPPEGEDVVDSDLAVQITAPDLDDDEAVSAPIDTAFYAAIPVPEQWDPQHLVPVIYMYGGILFDGGEQQIEPGWMFEPAQGLYDREQGSFLVEIPFIGGDNYPARVALVEHSTRTTEVMEPGLQDILDIYFPELEQVRQQQLGLDNAPFASHEADHEVRLSTSCLFGHGAAAPVEPNHSCSCGDWEDKIETAFFEALPYFKQLAGSPRPNLSSTTGSKFRSHTTYRYGIRDKTVSLLCSGQNGVYMYFPKSKSGVARTCGKSPDPERTTRHELFHAFQADYTRRRGDKWVSEGTARVAETFGSIENPESFEINLGVSSDLVSCNQGSVADLRPVDVGLHYAGAHDDVRGNPAYSAEAFWIDLLYRSTGAPEELDSLAALQQLGHLFELGRDTEAAISFVEQHTPFESLDEAHWRWVKNAAFEGDLTFPDGTYDHRCEFNPDVFSTEIPALSFPDDDEHHFGLLPRRSAQMIELEFPQADPDPIEYYEITWTGGNAQLYTDWMEPDGDGKCANPEVGHLHVTAEHPEGEESAPNTFYLINSGASDVRAHLLLQDRPAGGEQVVVDGPHEFESYRLDFESTEINAEAILEGGSIEAEVVMNATGQIVDYEWKIEGIDTGDDVDGSEAIIDSGPQVTWVQKENICPHSFPSDLAINLPSFTVTVRARDEFDLEVQHEWDVDWERAIVDASLAGLRIDPPDPTDDEERERLDDLIAELPFDGSSSVQVDDQVWPVGITEFIAPNSLTSGFNPRGFPINADYDPEQANEMSYRDEIYPWSVLLRVNAERCPASPTVGHTDMEIRARDQMGDPLTEWLPHNGYFDSEIFQGDFNIYGPASFEVRHEEFPGQHVAQIPPPCFLQRASAEAGDPDYDFPQGVNLSNYPECLHPQDKEQIFHEFSGGQQGFLDCAIDQLGGIDMGGESTPSLATGVNPCLPFDDLPPLAENSWDGLITPPNYTESYNVWCTTVGSSSCEATGMRIDIIGDVLSSSSATGIEDTYHQTRDIAQQVHPISPGRPEAFFLAWNAIAANIVAHYRPMGDSWNQLAEGLGDEQFRAVGHQDSVEPLNYGFASALYAATVWAPDLMDEDIGFSEYMDHIVDGAAAGAMLGAMVAVDDYQ